MKYSIGLDLGTLSGRAVLVEVSTGRECACVAMDYPHGVMDTALPDGTPLPADWALQDPRDYFQVIRTVITGVLREAKVDARDVIGVGIDATTPTILPCKKDGTPLCCLPGFESIPHAWVKLWKHHAAQKHAERMTAVAQARGERFLSRYGGRISSEWTFCKIWQTLDEAPDIYDQTDLFVDNCDWLIWQMTGSLQRSGCLSGYKALWSRQDGYPSTDFFKALDPRLENVVAEKFYGEIIGIGQKAGEITPRGAELTGLAVGTAVAVGIGDAHVAVCATDVNTEGRMAAVIGTSTCHLLLSQEERTMPGLCGAVEDGFVPGFYGLEAGQSCCGDHFAWFVKNCVPADYTAEAERRNISIHQYLREKAVLLKPGESGLVALDWWNGNRSVLVDFDLTGLMLGMTLQTKPEEMYRGLLEATAYGTRVIVESFRKAGVPVNEFIATGGIARKDALMMQIYADVLRMPVRVSSAKEGPAHGSAIFGAQAAGSAKGGYDSLDEARRVMACPVQAEYLPDMASADVYDKLYAEYMLLHDWFGRGGSDAMKRLKTIRAAAKEV